MDHRWILTPEHALTVPALMDRLLRKGAGPDRPVLVVSRMLTPHAVLVSAAASRLGARVEATSGLTSVKEADLARKVVVQDTPVETGTTRPPPRGATLVALEVQEIGLAGQLWDARAIGPNIVLRPPSNGSPLLPEVADGATHAVVEPADADRLWHELSSVLGDRVHPRALLEGIRQREVANPRQVDSARSFLRRTLNLSLTVLRTTWPIDVSTHEYFTALGIEVTPLKPSQSAPVDPTQEASAS